MGITNDRNDPGLSKIGPDGQQEKYLISNEIFDNDVQYIRPIRTAYKHLTCGVVTHMGRHLAETYAKDPKFYGATYCVMCRTHFPVAEFIWDGTDEVVGS